MENDLVKVINGVISFIVAMGAACLVTALRPYRDNPIVRRIALLPACTFITSGILGFWISVFPTGENFWVIRASLTTITSGVLFYLAWWFSGRGGTDSGSTDANNS